MAEPPSSPPGEAATPEESLNWYKNQYEQLALELADFRESSHELEAELEKDLEAADKRERVLQQKAETLQLDVDEWKEKCRKAREEANAAQNTLEKEITTLRDTNRTLQLKLRDIEVANDDFERQARNTTSSLEDVESKYNVAIERSVLMEEEIKMGEQEREKLRIEAQRLREELSDLKIEAEVLQDKVKKAEHRNLHVSTISTDLSIPESPTFENSPRSTASSPLITTPPDEVALPPPADIGSKPNPASELHDPPSPPMSDASAPLPRAAASKPKTPGPPMQKKSRLPSAEHSTTPKPRALASSTSSAIRPPGTRAATAGSATRTPAPKPRPPPTARSTSHKIPASTSLTHVRSLTAQMQRLEARVQNARSRLPAPISTTTPPRASPRSAVSGMPSSVTIRSRKRGPGSTASSMADETPTQSTGAGTGKHVPRLSTSGVSRLSFGPLPNRAGSAYDHDISRPSSRASVSSAAGNGGFAKPERPASRTEIARPMSRTSLGGARTPLGRPRSSLGGSLHGHSQSVSRIDEPMDEGEERAPSRRGTFSRLEGEGVGPSGIPMPGSARRQSGGIPRRTSNGVLKDPTTTGSGVVAGGGKPRKLSDLGETY